MVIVKRKTKYILYTKKKPRRRLGVFASKAKALARERQIQYFKYLKGR